MLHEKITIKCHVTVSQVPSVPRININTLSASLIGESFYQARQNFQTLCPIQERFIFFSRKYIEKIAEVWIK